VHKVSAGMGTVGVSVADLIIIVHLVFYFVAISEKNWRYALQAAKEMSLFHTGLFSGYLHKLGFFLELLRPISEC